MQQHFPLAPTAWNLTTSAQGMAQLSNKNPEEIERGQLRAKKGSLALGLGGGGKLGREVRGEWGSEIESKHGGFDLRMREWGM